MPKPPSKMKITVSKDGPYLVYGKVPITMQTINPNEEGLSWDWQEAKSFETRDEVRLCRCGRSNNKPYCDGSHLKVKFDGTETATRRPYVRQAEVFDGSTLTLSDAEELCAFARFCDPGGKIWGLTDQTDDSEARKLVIREANHCPSGRLVLHDKKTDEEIERKLKPSIGVVEDPALGRSLTANRSGGLFSSRGGAESHITTNGDSLKLHKCIKVSCLWREAFPNDRLPLRPVRVERMIMRSWPARETATSASRRDM